MANYNYDFDTMVKKMREIWTPEDFLRAAEKLMYAGYINCKQTSQFNHIQDNVTNVASDGSNKVYVLNSTDDFSIEKDFVLAA